MVKILAKLPPEFIHLMVYKNERILQSFQIYFQLTFETAA